MGSQQGRRDGGSALILAVISLLVTLAFAAVLLTAPQALLARGSSAWARERAVATADAGLRDAIVFLRATRASMLFPFTVPTGTNLNDISALPPASFYPTATSSPPAGEYVVVAGDRTTPNLRAVLPPGVPFVRGSFGPRGEYYYRFVARANKYFQVISVGVIPSATSDGRPVTVTVTAWVRVGAPSLAVPGAVSILDPTNAPILDPSGNPVDTYYDSQSGGEPPSIVGTDAGGGDPVAGVAFQDSSSTWGTGAAAIQGSPAFVGGSYGGGPTAAAWKLLQEQIEILRTLPDNTTGASWVLHLTYPDGLPVTTGSSGNFQTGVLYVTIPPGAVVDTQILVINGDNPVSGIFVLDVGANATFKTDPIYQKNGTSCFQGAFIVYQRGIINVPSGGLHFLDKRGNNPNFLQYNSVAIANALEAATPLFVIASYSVQ